jgi:hypothetical protein
MRRIITVLIVALLLAGCGPKRKTGAVSGTLTYKEQPVNGAALFLYAAGGDQKSAITVAVTQEGTFLITDVPPGEYKVVVQGTAGAQQVSPAALKKMPPDKAAEMKEKLSKMSTPPTIPFPNKYKDLKTTDLKVTITDKDQTIDLPMTGTAPAKTAPSKE